MWIEELRRRLEANNSRIDVLEEELNQRDDVSKEFTCTNERREQINEELRTLSENQRATRAEYDELVDNLNERNRNQDLPPYEGTTSSNEGPESGDPTGAESENRVIGSIGHSIVTAILEANNGEDPENWLDAINGFVPKVRSGRPLQGSINGNIMTEAHNAAEMLRISENAIDFGNIATERRQGMGVELAQATGYFIDLYNTRNTDGRGESWNEDQHPRAASTLRRGAAGANGDNVKGNRFEPTTLPRQVTPTELSFFVRANNRTLESREDAMAWIDGSVTLKYKEMASPEAAYAGSALNNVVGICNAALTGNGLIDAKGNSGAYQAYSIGSDTKAKDAMDQIIKARNGLRKTSPGMQECAINLPIFSEMQELRDNAGYVYPGLQEEPYRHRNIRFIPIDVGFEDEANGKYQWVINKWARNAEILHNGIGTAVLREIERLEGQTIFVVDGYSCYRYDNRFMIARGQART